MRDAREAMQRDPTKPTKRLFNEILVQHEREEGQGNMDQYQPEWDSVRSNMARFRSSLMPAIPATVQDVRIEGHWAQTWSNEP